MPVKACPDCGGKVSTAAPSCPHCGRRSGRDDPLICDDCGANSWREIKRKKRDRGQTIGNVISLAFGLLWLLFSAIWVIGGLGGAWFVVVISVLWTAFFAYRLQFQKFDQLRCTGCGAEKQVLSSS